MASLGSYLPSPGKVAWRLDAAQEDVTEGNKVRHVMIRNAEVREKPNPHVMYKVEVLTENDQWYLYIRYSQFHALHRKLMKLHGVTRDLLPPKRYHGNLSKQLIDQRRLQLETYLQKLIHSEGSISQSEVLSNFLDVPSHDIVKVTDILSRHLYHHGDELLMQATPIALSVNEMYSITKRLRLPFDASGVDTRSLEADPANLYSFIHQLKALRVCLPPPPTSVCAMPFELNHFRSLTTLKLDRVPLSQVLGLLSLQQQISKLCVARTLRSIRELLIESVEEKRSGGSPVLGGRCSSNVEQWRVTAMAKLTDNRVVVQPWHSLTVLVLSHNRLTYLDDSLQILPVLRELNLSHNMIQLLEMSYLCIPSLVKLNLAHNAINKIVDGRKVLEMVTSLNLSHNRLHSLDGITSFVSLTALNLNYNLVGSKKDLNRLMSLRKLETLCLQGNPISSAQGSRMVLLAKFMHKSRDIQLDGQEVSEKEQTKIHSYQDRYGNDPDNWPVIQSVITQPDSSHSNSSSGDADDKSDSSDDRYDSYFQSKPGSLPGSGGSFPRVTGAYVDDHKMHKKRKKHRELSRDGVTNDNITNPNNMEVSWQVHAPGEYKGSPILRLSREVRSHYHSSKVSNRQLSRESRTLSSCSNSAQPLISPSFLTAQLHQGRNTFLDETAEERYAVGSLHSDLSLLASREEPDGQSVISDHVTPPSEGRGTILSVPSATLSDPPSLSITTPPPTPQTGNNHKSRVSPAMIRSALEALQQIEDKERPLSLTPHEPTTNAVTTTTTTPILSEAVTSALTAWITHQNNSASTTVTPLISPPPSTPLEASTEVPCRPISASDLITALSSLIPTATTSMTSLSSPLTLSQEFSTGVAQSGGREGEGGGESGGEGGKGGGSNDCSNPYTVPATTPQEGIEEWYKLGIRPEDVIQALTALTIQETQRIKFEEHSATLSPITEEKTGFNRFSTESVATTRVSEVMVEGCERGEGEGGEDRDEGGKGRECMEDRQNGRCLEDGGREEKTGQEGERGGCVDHRREEEGKEKHGIIDTQQGSLTWETDDVIEITLNHQTSSVAITEKSSSLMTTTSHDDYDDDVIAYSTCGDVTDSEVSVFSPEQSNPTSPLTTNDPTRVSVTSSVSSFHDNNESASGSMMASMGTKHTVECLDTIPEAGNGGCLGVVGGSMDTDSSVVKATQQETT